MQLARRFFTQKHRSSQQREDCRGVSSRTSLKHHIHFSFILKLVIFICKQLKRPVAFSAVQKNKQAIENGEAESGKWTRPCFEWSKLVQIACWCSLLSEWDGTSEEKHLSSSTGCHAVHSHGTSLLTWHFTCHDQNDLSANVETTTMVECWLQSWLEPHWQQSETSHHLFGKEQMKRGEFLARKFKQKALDVNGNAKRIQMTCLTNQKRNTQRKQTVTSMILFVSLPCIWTLKDCQHNAFSAVVHWHHLQDSGVG